MRRRVTTTVSLRGAEGFVPPEVTLRRPTTADAGAIQRLCNVVTLGLYGEGDVDEAEVGSWFAMPDLEMFVAERGGEVVGYADVRRDEDGARFPIDVRVAPAARGAGVVDGLLAAAEASASSRAKPGALLRGFAAERDAEVRGALERAGYRLIRHAFHMLIELPEHLEPPEWPDGIALRTYDPERDEERVYEAQQESFEDHWDFHRIPLDRWRHFMLHRDDFDPTLWWLAEDGGELAAVCLNAWHFSGDRSYGWIGTLGVRSQWRRRGLALALLRHSFRDFKRRGALKVGLGVDAENTTGAVHLYRRAGMRPVRRNDTYEKEVRGEADR